MKNLIFLALLAHVFVASAFAAPTGKITFKDVTTGFPKGTKTLVRTVRLEDGLLLSASRYKAKPTQTVSIPDEPALLSINVTSPNKKIHLTGVSKKVISSLSTKKISKALTISLKNNVRKKKANLAQSRFATGSTGMLVGIPLDGIKVSGKDVESWMGKAQIQLLQTALSQNSACYRQPDGFVLVDLDPAVAAARQREFSLCASGRADISTCVTDKYAPPSQLITGTLTSNGGQAELSLAIVNGNGTEIDRVSATGSISSIAAWEVLTNLVQAQLTEKLCSTGTLSVTFSGCRTPACAFPCPNGGSYQIFPTIEGTASGPVGFGVSVSIGVGMGTLDCGGWSTGNCQNILCCERTSESQPEEISYAGSLNFLQNACICSTGDVAEFNLVAQLTGRAPLELERLVECPI